MSNEYRTRTPVTTSGGRSVWSFDDYLEECYTTCGERSTRVLDAATHEWSFGAKDVRNVKRKIA